MKIILEVYKVTFSKKCRTLIWVLQVILSMFRKFEKITTCYIALIIAICLAEKYSFNVNVSSLNSGMTLHLGVGVTKRKKRK